MSLERKLKTALDETRLLILGAQVLFGFQFNGTFQELFEQLPHRSRYLECAALLLIMTTVGLLIAPSMRHRIVEAGAASNDLLAAATLFAGLAMLRLALGAASISTSRWSAFTGAQPVCSPPGRSWSWPCSFGTPWNSSYEGGTP